MGAICEIASVLASHYCPAMQCEWILPREDMEIPARRISGALDVPMPLARVLASRGLVEAEDAHGYFDPKLRGLSAPEGLPGIPRAVARVDQALQTREPIVLYGDYDVDGVASLAFLSRLLRAYGGNVSCFLPVRAEEGYGLSMAGIERCWNEYRPSLVIAVDCGTNATREIEALRQRGCDVIVLDHHEASGSTPDAILVNPKAANHPLRYLCSAGVVFKLVHALLKRSPHPEIDLKEYLDLVTVATVADVVPLVAENRILVRRGLLQLGRTRWAGLRALMRVSSMGAIPRGSDIGFRLGPRINASGRLGTAQESLRLLETDDEGEALRLAASLERQNRQRQAVERTVADEAEVMVSGAFDPVQDASIVVGARAWHQGVLGIVAARIMRKYHRPAVVVGFDEGGLGRGSGRSVEGFSLIQALTRCETLLETFGGHDLAAGLSIQEGSFPEFQKTFETFARTIQAARRTPRLELDAQIELEEANHPLLDAQDRLEPFGHSNAQPVFFVRSVSPARPPQKLKEKHVRIVFEVGGRRVEGIFFNGVADVEARPPWDIAFRLERNTFQGRNEPQLQIIALRSAA